MLTENRVVRVGARSCDDTLDAVQCTWFVSILLTVFCIDFYIFFLHCRWCPRDHRKFDIYLFSSIIRLCASFKTFPSWHIEEWRVTAFRSYWLLQMLAVFSRRWVYKIFFIFPFFFFLFTASLALNDRLIAPRNLPSNVIRLISFIFFHHLFFSLFFFFQFGVSSFARVFCIVLYR